MNAWLIRQYFTVILQVFKGNYRHSTLPNPLVSLLPSVFSPVILSHTHTDTQTQAGIKCHSQLKDNSPVWQEEEVCETRPVHPYKNVRVVGDLQLRQEGNIPEGQVVTHQSLLLCEHCHYYAIQKAKMIPFHGIASVVMWRALHNSPVFVVHHTDLQVRHRLEGIYQLQQQQQVSSDQWEGK